MVGGTLAGGLAAPAGAGMVPRLVTWLRSAMVSATPSGIGKSLGENN